MPRSSENSRQIPKPVELQPHVAPAMNSLRGAEAALQSAKAHELCSAHPTRGTLDAILSAQAHLDTLHRRLEVLAGLIGVDLNDGVVIQSGGTGKGGGG